jgi:hypothetical protein
MMKKMRFAGLVLTSLMLVGCASSMFTEVNKPASEITVDKTKAYITFSRPEYVGAAISNTVIEFDPITETTKFVGILGPETRIIYELDPGTHYFYMHGGENYSRSKVTVSAGKMYYMQTKVGMGVMAARFYFNPLTRTEMELISSFIGKECTETFLDKNNFIPESEEDTSGLIKASKYYSNSLNIGITCDSGRVASMQNAVTVESLNDATLITPNKKALTFYEKEVDAKYVATVSARFKELTP